MRLSWWTKELLAGITLLGLVGVAAAQAKGVPTVEQMLSIKPVQKGIVYTTPTPQEFSKCKVEVVDGAAKGTSAFVLRDGQGQMLRKFYDSNGDRYPDQWSYYKDGLEVYREIDGNFNGKADKFIWLNSGGMKIGIDRNEDGVIDAWLALSPEELSQEVVKAIAAKDYRLLEALFVTEEDLVRLGAPAKEIARIRELQKGSAAKFRQTCAKLTQLNEQTHWQHLETNPPSRLSAEATGMKQDVLMHYRGLILCECAGKHEWIQLGEMVQVGEAWKLLDAPLPGDSEPIASTNPATTAPHVSAEEAAVQELMEKLVELDKNSPPDAAPGPNAALADYYWKRADIQEQLAAKVTEKERLMWWKQVADSLASAVQRSAANDNRAADRLTKLATRLGREMQGSEIAGCVAFREIISDYTKRIEGHLKAEELIALQTKYHDRLLNFVSVYPKTEEAADALLELAKLYEYGAKDREGDAKRCYEQIARNFPASRQAVKANGALRRMNLEGKMWELGAPVIAIGGPPFSMDKLRGKYVVVYYWASWCQSTPADFVKLKKLTQDYGSKMEVVGINSDDTQAEAESFLRRVVAPGFQLFAAGGMENPLAAHYGLIIFPNVFLLGPDGKVLSRTVEVNGLEEELKKVIK